MVRLSTLGVPPNVHSESLQRLRADRPYTAQLANANEARLRVVRPGLGWPAFRPRSSGGGPLPE
jgi:hypothetical protein